MFRLFALTPLAFGLMVACSPNPEIPPTLEVSPTTLSLQAGDPSTPLETTVRNSSASVLWTLEGPGSLSTLKGLTTRYTPPAVLNTPSSAKITATLEGTDRRKVIDVALAIKPTLSIIPPANLGTVTAGSGKIRFSAARSNAQRKGRAAHLNPLPSPILTWTFEGPGDIDPTVGDYTDYTPPTDIPAPTEVTLKVQYGSLEQNFRFSVQPRPAQARLSLSPSSSSAVVGGAGVPFTATLQNNSEVLNWTLEGPGSISSTTGSSVTYTPPAQLNAPGTATLTVRAGNLERSATIALTPQPALTVSPSSATFTAGDAGQAFSADLKYSTEPITWTLEGMGSLSSSTGLEVVYTPPSSVTREETVRLTARAGIASQFVILTIRGAVSRTKITGILKEANTQGLLPWSKGAVEIVFTSPLRPGDPNTSYLEVGRVSVGTDGLFQFVLPSRSSLPPSTPFLSFLKNQTCSGSLISESSAALGSGLRAEAWKNGVRVGSLIPGLNASSGSGTTSSGYFFSESVATLNGGLRCSFLPTPFISDFAFDLSFKLGWNQFKNVIDPTPTPILQFMTTVEFSELNWILQSN